MQYNRFDGRLGFLKLIFYSIFAFIIAILIVTIEKERERDKMKKRKQKFTNSSIYFAFNRFVHRVINEGD